MGQKLKNDVQKVSGKEYVERSKKKIAKGVLCIHIKEQEGTTVEQGAERSREKSMQE